MITNKISLRFGVISLFILLAAALSASVVCFLVSNFGVWLSSGMYPYTWVGLEACYVAGIPFFKNTIAGDLLYVALLFGAFEWRVRRIPALRLQTVIHQPNEAHGKDLSAL